MVFVLYGVLTLLTLLWKFITQEKAIFLIPEGYQGKVVIYYNQKTGVEPMNEKGRRVYVVPQDGVLLTKADFIGGYIDYDYYYVDSQGNRTKLEEVDERDATRDSTTVGIYRSGTAGVRGGSNEPNSVEFLEFYVASSTTFESFFDFKYEEAFERKVDSILNLKK